ncbi:MAG TPA: hypothetical protein VEW42_03135 [Candidatus Eisenbacteria bacterium]|nr:hypothetical protein [Candidatus Eisenbacteria bacterium]
MAGQKDAVLPYIPAKTRDQVKELVRRILSGKPGERRLVKVKDLKKKVKE